MILSAIFTFLDLGAVLIRHNTGHLSFVYLVRIYPLFRFPGGSAGKESACNSRDLGSIPRLGQSPGEGNSYPLQYSGLENSMDCVVRGIERSGTQLSDFHFHFSEDLSIHSSRFCFCNLSDRVGE